MPVERLAEQDGPVIGRDILPFRSSKLYDLYEDFERRCQRGRAIRIQTRAHFAWTIKSKSAEELSENLHRWPKTLETAFEDEIPA